MSAEYFERKKKALDALISAQAAFLKALEELPREWAEQAVQDLQDAMANRSQNRKLCDSDLSTPNPSLSISPTPGVEKPSQAILRLLRETFPGGLMPLEIVRPLVGTVKSKSDDQGRVLYSAIIGLKNRGKIRQSQDGRYFYVGIEDNEE